MMKNFIGIDIGGTKCAVVKGDLKRGVVEKIRFETAGVRETLDKIYSAVEKMMPAVAIGISCGGPLDEKLGIIQSPPNLPGWDDVHIKDELESRFCIPVKLLNDANAGAIAEWKFGAGKECENMLFLTFGTGLGAGMILGGRLYSGTNGNAGEIGHIRLADDGPVGYGKAGSFEGFCSGGGIAKLAKAICRDALKRGDPISFAKNEGEIEAINTKALADLAHGGDADAKRIFDISAEKLGAGLSVVIDIINPERIVIGGVYSRAADLFASGMRAALEREALAPSLSVCEIVPAALGEEIGDIAALSAAITAAEG